MTTANRYDVGNVTGSQMTSNGYLLADCYPTRVGVFQYRRADGSVVNELRPPEEVFSAASLASLQLLPITEDHPNVAVTPDNVKSLAVGYTGEVVTKDGIHVKTRALVHAPASIKRLKEAPKSQRKDQMSCGYRCRLDPTPGIFEGQHYDAVQRDIVYNHVAFVVEGRAGPDNKIHLDSNDAIMTDSYQSPSPPVAPSPFSNSAVEIRANQTEQTRMFKVKLDGIDYDVPEVTAQVINKFVEDKKGEVAKLAAKADSLEADLSTAKAELQKANDPARIAQAVKARLELERCADKAKVRADGLSDEEVKKQVVKALKPSLVLDGKDAAYLDAAFDIAKSEISQADKRDKAVASIRDVADSKQTETADQYRARLIAETNAKNRAR